MKIVHFRWRIVALLILSLALFLSACASDEPETPTATAVAEVVEEVVATDVPATEPPPTEEPTEVPTEEPTAEAPTAVPTEEPTPEPTVPPVVEETTSATFEEASCEFEVPNGREVTCGWLTVPEDRTDPDNDNTIQLHVAIFASDSENPAPDPVIYLEGGPGGDALEAIPFTLERQFAPFLANHDFIMFDQRGTGYSEPSLACPELTEKLFETLEQDIAPEEAMQQSFETLTVCHERLAAEGVNFTAYNSAASAADLNDLRIALGYEEWNLLGISYGTRLAQTTMRDYPMGLRSVILDSAYPIEANLLTDTPANVARAFDVFFAGCANDADCAAAYPDLEQVYFDTIAQLDEAPAIVPVTNLLTGDTYDAYFRGGDLLGVLFQSLYATPIIPDLPKMIYDINQGNYTGLSTLLSNFLINSEFVSIGMQYSVQCHEENLFVTQEEVTAAAEAHPELLPIFAFSQNIGAGAFDICEFWGAGMADAIEDEPVTSDIPTLVLAGEYDPITPPEWGQVVSEYLDTAYFYEFPGVGHGVSISAGACGHAIVEAFWTDPMTAPDAACISEMSGPEFTLLATDAVSITLVPFTNDTFGIEGVVPEGWEEAGPGVFSRGDGALDQTVILQQALLGFDVPQLLELLSGQLGWESVPDSTGTYETAARTWTLYETQVQGFPGSIAVAEGDGKALVVLLISTVEEQEFLFNEVFIPALEAYTVQE